MALLAMLAGVISWLFRLSYDSMRSDRDWWRQAYQDHEATEWKQLQLMSDGIAALRLALEQRKPEQP